MENMASIRFTQKAQGVLNRALTYARDMGHTYIGSEHLLLGLIGEEEGVAAKILAEHGVTFDRIKSTVESFPLTSHLTLASLSSNLSLPLSEAVES